MTLAPPMRPGLLPFGPIVVVDSVSSWSECRGNCVNDASESADDHV